MKLRNRISRFRVWLKNIPIQDPVDNQMAALLQVMLLGLIAVFVTATLANLFLSTDYSEILIDSLINISIFGIPFILLRRGFFQMSIYYLIALFLILVTTVILASDLRSEADALIFFTLGILLAGLLIGQHALIFTFAISSAIILFLALREPDPTLKLDYISIAGNFILLNGLMSFFINSFGITLRTNLRASLQREEKIKELNQQLQAQIAELERFTYTVSHDLRSPLVTIKGFIGMLDEDMRSDHLDKVQDDFKRISNAAEKMDSLLSELLELSRIGRIINSPKEIDTVQLIHDAIDSLDARIRSKNIIINIASDFPALYGDHTRLREVFENLIDNAAKYAGNKKQPIIEIGVRNQSDETVFFVKDNGIGVEKQYQEKIFGLFEKLDSTIEGTGIGLALVKRIIETHGGRIWVKSEGLGQGSTFCFTIPDSRNT